MSLLPIKARELGGRLSAGAFIFHSGLDKWNVDEEHATAVHGMAANAFPPLKEVPPQQFVKALAASEMAVGAMLCAPFVPAAVAGAALTGFSGALLAMYLRTPALRKPGSIWPSPQGIGVSKDVWMLGIGLSLLTDAVTRRRRP
jgi:hypothetical protein